MAVGPQFHHVLADPNADPDADADAVPNAQHVHADPNADLDADGRAGRSVRQLQCNSTMRTDLHKLRFPSSEWSFRQWNRRADRRATVWLHIPVRGSEQVAVDVDGEPDHDAEHVRAEHVRADPDADPDAGNVFALTLAHLRLRGRAMWS
jgi:hypothetical protein